MATDSVIRPVYTALNAGATLEIPPSLRQLLNLQESGDHYLIRTLGGATIFRLKSEIEYPWQLLQGILDDGKDTSAERKNEKEWEFAHDEQKLGKHSAI